MVIERWGLLHIHLFINLYFLLNCVHKYTVMYDSIDLLVPKGTVVVKREIYPYPAPSEFINTNIYDGIGSLALKGVVVVNRRL